MIRYFLAGVVILVVTSCGAFAQATKKSQRPSGEVARVEVSGQLTIVSIDGGEGQNYHSLLLFKPWHKLDFEPGDHEIVVRYAWHEGSKSITSDPVRLELPGLKAGYKYRVESKMKYNESRFSLVFYQVSPKPDKQK